MKSRGSTSTKKLNDIIREKLNPIPADKANIPSVKDSEFRLNDRVMLTKNTRNAEGATRMLVNGDLGFITDIRWVQRKVTVTFDDGERGIFEFSEFCRKFELAYASTIHKCQGQEYKAAKEPVIHSRYKSKERMYPYRRKEIYQNGCRKRSSGTEIYHAGMENQS